MDMTVDRRGLYERDEHAWLVEQAAAIARGRLDEIDRDHLVEYLSEMAGRDNEQLESRLIIMLAHLLKIRFQPDRHTPSWTRGVREQQSRIARLLRRLPSMAGRAPALMESAYRDAVRRAADETRLPKSAFPTECPWTFDAALTCTCPEAPVRPWTWKRG